MSASLSAWALASTPTTTPLAAATGGSDHRTLTLVLFLSVVAITLYVTLVASRQNKTAADYYAAGRSFSGSQNGMAISGDYMSAASFLGISGAIALSGYDGFLYSIGFLVAWLVALLLVAELLRNSGRFTLADQSCRSACGRGRSVRPPRPSPPSRSRSST